MPYFVKIEITVSVRRTMKKYDNITVVYLQDMKASITSKSQFYWWRKPEDPEKTTDLKQS
jgi:hypothetical protein